MYKIKWSLTAKQELSSISSYYIEKVGLLFAQQIFNTIIKEVEKLKEFPNRSRIGRVKKTREYVIKRLPYIAVITVDESSKTVNILNILHTARKYP